AKSAMAASAAPADASATPTLAPLPSAARQMSTASSRGDPPPDAPISAKRPVPRAATGSGRKTTSRRVSALLATAERQQRPLGQQVAPLVESGLERVVAQQGAGRLLAAPVLLPVDSGQRHRDLLAQGPGRAQQAGCLHRL